MCTLVSFHVRSSMNIRRWTKRAYPKVCFVLCVSLTVVYVLSRLFFGEDYQQQIYSTLYKIDREKLMYPNDTYFVMIRNVIAPKIPTGDPGDNEISICTQTSLGNLHQIINLSRKWDGRISVAVFSYGDEISIALHYIILMHKCFRDIQHKVSFHLVYPVSNPPSNLMSIYEKEFECSTIPLLRESFAVENYALRNISYPVNLLRNVALVHSTSAYVLNLDVDVVPSKGMKKEMETFLEERTADEKQKKLAYIVPCFETNITLYDSLSKEDLFVAVKSGSVRMFNLKRCPSCHIRTNYTRWMSLPYPAAMSASYDVEYRFPFEPFYVADKRRLPLFDTRFKQFGKNRVSQVCEAYISGYDFVVMNNAFVIHDGFKDIKEYQQWKHAQNMINTHIFLGIFKQDLKTKYPESMRKF